MFPMVKARGPLQKTSRERPQEPKDAEDRCKMALSGYDEGGASMHSQEYSGPHKTCASTRAHVVIAT